MSQDTAFFCPACGTSSIKASNLAGGDASCTICEWKGTREELLNIPFEHSFDSQEEMLKRFVNQLASALAKTSAFEVGKVLTQWGFLDEKNLTEELKIYIKVMAIAATKAAVETRQQLERVRVQKEIKRDGN